MLLPSQRMLGCSEINGYLVIAADIFQDLQPLVQSALDGFNVSIFAYGQTGAGKTFTMVRIHLLI